VQTCGREYDAMVQKRKIKNYCTDSAKSSKKHREVIINLLRNYYCFPYHSMAIQMYANEYIVLKSKKPGKAEGHLFVPTRLECKYNNKHRPIQK